MKYKHLTREERHRIGALRSNGQKVTEIARELGRNPGTISRELNRNRYVTDGRYRAHHAQNMYQGRRRRSRQGSKISEEVLEEAEKLLRGKYSPEQAAGYLARNTEHRISHETIYRHVWKDKQFGGDLYLNLRCAGKKRRKRYGAYDSRGRLAGKRMIGERPEYVNGRESLDHWEIDTVMGKSSHCILTMVERKSGYVQIGLLKDRTVLQTNARMLKLMKQHQGRYQTITSDNGCEFHGYKVIEEKTSVPFYFATPHHSWERGTNENTNGLIRQYLPKGLSMADLTQARCNAIAHELNTRPRKRHDYHTPEEIFYSAS